MIVQFLILFISGSLAGILAGLLGIGGATVMVPLYWYYFKIQDLMPLEKQYHMAIACSLAVIFINSIIATREHYKNQNIDLALMKKFMPGLILGVFIGTVISQILGGMALKKLFSLFLAILAIHIFFQTPSRNHPTHSTIILHAIAILVGMLNSLFGIAGGIIMIPFFNYLGLDIKKAMGTSIALSIPISLIANLSLNLSSKYFLIDWMVVISTACASLIFIPIGARIAKKTSSSVLKKIFSIFLLVVAIAMFLSN
jgi:uncharacterized protein